MSGTIIDFRDNSDHRRLRQPSDEDRKRIEKYQRAIRLIEAMPSVGG